MRGGHSSSVASGGTDSIHCLDLESEWGFLQSRDLNSETQGLQKDRSDPPCFESRHWRLEGGLGGNSSRSVFAGTIAHLSFGSSSELILACWDV